MAKALYQVKLSAVDGISVVMSSMARKTTASLDQVRAAATRLDNGFRTTTSSIRSQSRRLSDSFRQIGASAQRAFSNLNAGGLGGLANGLKRVTEPLNAFRLGIAGIATSAIAGAVSDLNALGVAGAKADTVFRQLIGSIGDYDTVLAGLRAATGGIVDDMLLMNSTSSLLQMGIADSVGDLERHTEAAVKLGAAMGRSAEEALENWALLMANQSYLRLDTYGISSGAVRTRAAELRDEGLDKESAFAAATLEAAEEALGRLGSAADVSSTALARFETRFQNFVAGIGQSLNALFETAARGAERLESIYLNPDETSRRQALASEAYQDARSREAIAPRGEQLSNVLAQGLARQTIAGTLDDSVLRSEIQTRQALLSNAESYYQQLQQLHRDAQAGIERETAAITAFEQASVLQRLGMESPVAAGGAYDRLVAQERTVGFAVEGMAAYENAQADIADLTTQLEALEAAAAALDLGAALEVSDWVTPADYETFAALVSEAQALANLDAEIFNPGQVAQANELLESVSKLDSELQKAVKTAKDLDFSQLLGEVPLDKQLQQIFRDAGSLTADASGFMQDMVDQISFGGGDTARQFYQEMVLPIIAQLNNQGLTTEAAAAGQRVAGAFIQARDAGLSQAQTIDLAQQALGFEIDDDVFQRGIRDAEERINNLYAVFQAELGAGSFDTAERALAEMDSIADDLSQNPLWDSSTYDAARSGLDDMVSSGRELSSAINAAKASLDALTGVSGGGALGEIGDLVADGIEDDALRGQLEKAFGRRSGRITDESEAVEGWVADAFRAIARDYNAEQTARAGEAFVNAMAEGATPEEAFATTGFTWTPGTQAQARQRVVQPGDTLSGIALQEQLPLSQIIELNPQISDPGLIFAGQTINLGEIGTTGTLGIGSPTEFRAEAEAAIGDEPLLLPVTPVIESSAEAALQADETLRGQQGTSWRDLADAADTAVRDTAAIELLPHIDQGQWAEAIEAITNKQYQIVVEMVVSDPVIPELPELIAIIESWIEDPENAPNLPEMQAIIESEIADPQNEPSIPELAAFIHSTISDPQNTPDIPALATFIESRIADPHNVPDIPELEALIASWIEAPENVPSIPELEATIQSWIDDPNNMPAMPEMLALIQSWIQDPENAPTTPEMLMAIQSYILNPENQPALPDLTAQIASFILDPENRPAIPAIAAVIQSQIADPENVPSIPELTSIIESWIADPANQPTLPELVAMIDSLIESPDAPALPPLPDLIIMSNIANPTNEPVIPEYEAIIQSQIVDPAAPNLPELALNIASFIEDPANQPAIPEFAAHITSEIGDPTNTPALPELEAMIASWIEDPANAPSIPELEALIASWIEDPQNTPALPDTQFIIDSWISDPENQPSIPDISLLIDSAIADPVPPTLPELEAQITSFIADPTNEPALPSLAALISSWIADPENMPSIPELEARIYSSIDDPANVPTLPELALSIASFIADPDNAPALPELEAMIASRIADPMNTPVMPELVAAIESWIEDPGNIPAIPELEAIIASWIQDPDNTPSIPEIEAQIASWIADPTNTPTLPELEALIDSAIADPVAPMLPELLMFIPSAIVDPAAPNLPEMLATIQSMILAPMPPDLPEITSVIQSYIADPVNAPAIPAIEAIIESWIADPTNMPDLPQAIMQIQSVIDTPIAPALPSVPALSIGAMIDTPAAPTLPQIEGMIISASIADPDAPTLPEIAGILIDAAIANPHAPDLPQIADLLIGAAIAAPDAPSLPEIAEIFIGASIENPDVPILPVIADMIIAASITNPDAPILPDIADVVIESTISVPDAPVLPETDEVVVDVALDDSGASQALDALTEARTVSITAQVQTENVNVGLVNVGGGGNIFQQGADFISGLFGGGGAQPAPTQTPDIEPATMSLELDADAWQTEVSSLREEVEAIEAKVVVQFDTDLWSTQLAAVNADLDGIRNKEIVVNVTPRVNWSQFERSAVPGGDLRYSRQRDGGASAVLVQ